MTGGLGTLQLAAARRRGVRLSRAVVRVCDWITEVAKAFIGGCIAAIVLITLAAVWWRYVLNAPISWIEQVSNMLFIWVTFIGAAVLYRQRLHIGVDLLLEMLTGRAKDVLYWTIELLNLLFIIVLLIFSTRLSWDVLDNTFGALDITPAWFYVSAPVASSMMLLFFFEKIVDPSKRQPQGAAGDF